MTAVTGRASAFTTDELWTLIDALNALDDQSNWGQHGEALHEEFMAVIEGCEEAS